MRPYRIRCLNASDRRNHEPKELCHSCYLHSSPVGSCCGLFQRALARADRLSRGHRRFDYRVAGQNHQRRDGSGGLTITRGSFGVLRIHMHQLAHVSPVRGPAQAKVHRRLLRLLKLTGGISHLGAHRTADFRRKDVWGRAWSQSAGGYDRKRCDTGEEVPVE